jgi:IclR family transcriptional regulator, pca regulon regulatory protein
VLLGAMRPQALNAWLRGHELQRLTPHTIVDPKALRTRIEQARRDDFAVAREEHELGVLALAVPLRDMKGSTLAALNVVVSPQRMDEARLVADCLPTLADAARELRPLL